MKKLIIVCEGKLRRYGVFLAQLISLQDDKGEEVVGVKMVLLQRKSGRKKNMQQMLRRFLQSSISFLSAIVSCSKRKEPICKYISRNTA